MTQRIRLMADYQAHPLWWDDRDHVGDIDPASLSLSEHTRLRLAQWQEQYDRQMNWDDPKASAFFDEQEQKVFELEGIQIWKLLRTELSPDYEVWYFSESSGRLIESPDDLPT
jgi:hypothetical protein